jgi:hypothetical protein
MLDDHSIPSDEIEFNLDARAFLALGLWRQIGMGGTPGQRFSDARPQTARRSKHQHMVEMTRLNAVIGACQRMSCTLKSSKICSHPLDAT